MRATPSSSLPAHWPEYLIEAFCLGAFMVSASGFAMLLEHPDSPVRAVLADDFVRRALMGVAMGLTAIALIYSPWGRQSGAHMNPAVTLAFFRLGKVAPADALAYMLGQFIGGAAAMLGMGAVFAKMLSVPQVHYVATLPGNSGTGVAFLAEAFISGLLMAVVLVVSNRTALARFTGLFAGVCVALFITFEAPLSGMSMNPARTFASALAARDWTALWIYFTAPPLGMLAATELYHRLAGARACAKLHHQNTRRCIFCEYQRQRAKNET
ncbi:MAG: aquaporin [Verrucomicrobiota bacterium]